MMLLNSTDTRFYRKHIKKHPNFFGYFISIRKLGIPSSLKRKAPWAADNECFNGNFEPRSFMLWLMTLVAFIDSCLFVVAPDVVGNAVETLRRFPHWRDSLRGLGFPIALALQDGMKSRQIPWDDIDAVFVGGSTEWKMSQDALNLLVEAGERGLWRHVGRVNSVKRIAHFWDFADSFDGTGFAIAPNQKLKLVLPYMTWRQNQLKLWENI